MTATKSLESRLYKSKIDLPESERVKAVGLLNTTLAATLDLWSQVKQAHWNIKGKNFYQLHLLFDEVAEVVYKFIDMVAERATALGGIAKGTARQSASHSFLPEYPDTDRLDEEGHLNALSDRLSAYGKHIREGIEQTDQLDDEGTNDLYIEISREIDAKLWFIEAHLQGNNHR